MAGPAGPLSIVFGTGRSQRLVATRANGQPAFGVYVSDPHAPVFHANGLMVVTLAGEEGKVLEAFFNTALAAQLIYRESGAPINPCRFFDSDADAMADMFCAYLESLAAAPSARRKSVVS